MPTCQTGHLRIHYQDIGKKSAPVLLLLHGWGHSWETWAPYIPELSAKYRLIIPDLPGFGHSDGAHTGWNMREYSTWLAAFLQRCEITEIHAAIGHSFGGKLISFAWAAYGKNLELPAIKNGLYIISASGIVPPQNAVRRLFAAALQVFPQNLKRSLFAPLRRFLYERLLNETDYLLATPFQEATLRKILAEDILETVSTPLDISLHIAWGKNDTAVPLWMAYQYRALSQHSDVFVIPEADHFVHLTQPRLIIDWLESTL